MRVLINRDTVAARSPSVNRNVLRPKRWLMDIWINWRRPFLIEPFGDVVDHHPSDLISFPDDLRHGASWRLWVVNDCIVDAVISGWAADIWWNILVGSDSNVYEGRRWNHFGAQTLNYNLQLQFIAFGMSQVRCNILQIVLAIIIIIYI
jgi:hypothetical protein